MAQLRAVQSAKTPVVTAPGRAWDASLFPRSPGNLLRLQGDSGEINTAFHQDLYGVRWHFRIDELTLNSQPISWRAVTQPDCHILHSGRSIRALAILREAGIPPADFGV